jgi:GNAT superfamily N-acetyltransferase
MTLQHINRYIMQSITRFRTMTENDIGAGLLLCRHAGWNQVARDWELFLRLGPNDCRLALAGDESFEQSSERSSEGSSEGSFEESIGEEKIIGTVATIHYEQACSWIGMVLVDPAFRGRGVGTRLLQEALQVLDQEKTVKLDATPAGRAVYLKLGFIDEYPLSRLVCRRKEMGVDRGAVLESLAGLNDSIVKPINREEMGRIALFDRTVFGGSRSLLLDWLYEGAPQYAFYAEDQDEIQGYCFGREGHHFTQIGPVVARNITTARALITAALQQFNERSVVLDLPEGNTEWMEWLVSIGFTPQRRFVRMYKGANAHPGITGFQFAITGPEFG